jgi:hypothetical protein
VRAAHQEALVSPKNSISNDCHAQVYGSLRNLLLYGYGRSTLLLFEGWRLRLSSVPVPDTQRFEVSALSCCVMRIDGPQESRGPQECRVSSRCLLTTPQL